MKNANEQSNKRIFIHAGPPKTGSSTIQKWMLDNKHYLEQNGILYPSHDINSNGISSGNLSAVTRYSAKNGHEFDREKIKKLLDFFYASDFDILVLSSEFFFLMLNGLVDHIIKFDVVLYIRDPMEKRVSQYNQGVKRHLYTHPFPQDVSKKVNDISTIKRLVSDNPDLRFHLHLFGSKYFFKKNLVSDFLSILGKKNELSGSVVNQSYQLEALELKRWLNSFDLKHLEPLVDRCLQTYTCGVNSYSLLAPRKHRKQIHQDIIVLKKFFKNHHVSNSDTFVDDLRVNIQKPYFNQSNQSLDIECVCEFLRDKLGWRSIELYWRVTRAHNFYDCNYSFIFSNVFRMKNKILFPLLYSRFLFRGKSITSLKEFAKFKKNVANEKINSFELLLHLASLAEANEEFNFSLKLYRKALSVRPNNEFVKNKLLSYKERKKF